MMLSSPRWHRIFCVAALGALLAAASHARRAGLSTERPYEDALYRMALDVSADSWPDPDSLWSEHPLLPYWVLRCVSRFSGGSVVTRDLIWAGLFGLAFLAALHFSWPGPSECAEHPGRCTVQATCLRGILTLTAFLSPMTLVASFRILPDAVAFLALAATLLCVRSFATSRSWMSAISLAGALAILSMSHVYGLFVAIGVLAGSCVVVHPVRGQAVYIKLSIVAALLASTAILDQSAILARVGFLRNHYWAARILGGTPPAPLSGIWYAASEFTAESPRLVGLLQWAVGVLLVAIVFRGRDDAARIGAVASLSVCAMLWLFQAATGDRIVVYHWLGLLWILGACTLARALDGWMLWAAALAAMVVVLIPGVASATMTAPIGPASVREAAMEIHRLSDGADAIVFGGTRAFVLFEPELDEAELQRSFVYLRQEHFPDSFIGRRLIPKTRLVADSQWAEFKRKRIVLVLVHAPQKISVPTDRWAAIAQRSFAHNAYSISLITVELLEERVDPEKFTRDSGNDEPRFRKSR